MQGTIARPNQPLTSGHTAAPRCHHHGWRARGHSAGGRHWILTCFVRRRCCAPYLPRTWSGWPRRCSPGAISIREVYSATETSATAHLVLQGRLKIVLPSHHRREASLAIIRNFRRPIRGVGLARW